MLLFKMILNNNIAKFKVQFMSEDSIVEISINGKESLMIMDTIDPKEITKRLIDLITNDFNERLTEIEVVSSI